MTRISALKLACASFLFVSSASSAQEVIEYDAGDYVFAELATDISGQDQTEEAEVRGAERVITARQGEDRPVVFVSRPHVQAIPSIEPDDYAHVRVVKHGPKVAPAAHEHGNSPRMGHSHAHRHDAPAAHSTLYAYPAVFGARPTQHVSAPYLYAYQGGRPSLPPGARVVAFDREAWLTECSRRIAPRPVYDSGDDRAAVGAIVGAAAGGLIGNRVAGRGDRTAGTLIGAGLGAIGGAAIADATGPTGRPAADDTSWTRCENYLDGYMESARSGALHGHQSATGEYMLVPVTVMVPQQARVRGED